VQFKVNTNTLNKILEVKGQNLFIYHHLYRQAGQCALQSNIISHNRQSKKH